MRGTLSIILTILSWSSSGRSRSTGSPVASPKSRSPTPPSSGGSLPMTGTAPGRVLCDRAGFADQCGRRDERGFLQASITASWPTTGISTAARSRTMLKTYFQYNCVDTLFVTPSAIFLYKRLGEKSTPDCVRQFVRITPFSFGGLWSYSGGERSGHSMRLVPCRRGIGQGYSRAGIGQM